jgi:C4-dicarboxylate-specific signal transduction histidine kinase
MITSYRSEYAQVLMNILNNARDALVKRNASEPRILMSSFTEGDKTVVTITDNAEGIAEDIMDKLFDPYFTTKGPDKGTGIGLFMSKTIIENMGGRLTALNTGQGAEFRMRF